MTSCCTLVDAKKVNRLGFSKSIVGTESLKRHVVPCNTYLTSSVSSVKDRNHIFKNPKSLLLIVVFLRKGCRPVDWRRVIL